MNKKLAGLLQSYGLDAGVITDEQFFAMAVVIMLTIVAAPGLYSLNMPRLLT